MVDLKNSAAGKFWLWLIIIAIPVGIIAFAVMQKTTSAPVVVADANSLNNTDAQAVTEVSGISIVATPSVETTPVTQDKTPTKPSTNTVDKPTIIVTPVSLYKDGSYYATGDYNSPGGNEQVGVNLTIKDGVVTDSTFTVMADGGAAVDYQNMFASNYRQFVIGKKIEDINVSNVSGSSLTPQGFNDAVNKIKTQAQA